MKIGAFQFPFFPMRPFTGNRLFTREACEEAMALHDRGELILQKKLNGDRGVVGVAEDGVHLANRYGAFYKMTCEGLAKFRALPVGTLIDGEIWKKQFYPFEVIQYGPTQLFNERNTQLRIDHAESICNSLGIEWLFTPPTLEWMDEWRGSSEVWEGVVAKEPRCKYFPMASEGSESSKWRRMKWS